MQTNGHMKTNSRKSALRLIRVRKLLLITLFALGVTQGWAYSDHRGRRVDSLEAMLKSDNPPRGEKLLKAYTDLMWGYMNTNGERATHYARKALALSYQGNWLNARTDALRILGLVAYGSEDYDTALGYFNWALAVTDSMRGEKRYAESDIDDNLSTLYGSIANLYNLQDQGHLAIAYYQRALPIFEKYGWKESCTILYHNVGELYEGMGNTEEAERNYLMAKQAAQESGDSLMVALAQKGLLKVYVGMGDYDRAAEASARALAYYARHQDEELGDYTTVLVETARMHLMQGHQNLEQAKALAREALGHAQEDLMPETRFDIYAVCCELAMHEGRWQEALQYGLQSVHENDDEATLTDASCYALLAQVYAELGDALHARAYINKVYSMMERFATDHYQSGLSQMQVLYETEKKAAEIRQLQRERRLYTWGSLLAGVVLVLVALTFFLLWCSVRLRRRTALIQARLEGELDERVRLARDLHDRLGGQLTALRQQLTLEGGERDRAVELTDGAIREMRAVAHHLLPDSLRRYGLRTALGEFCQALSGVSFSFLGSEDCLPRQDQEAIYCIAHELVNNAAKHSGAQHIQVQLMADEEGCSIVVSDDGNGRLTAEQAEGMGWRNIQERVAALNGVVDVSSRPGQGTEVSIVLPARS